MAAAEYRLPDGRPSTQGHVATTARWWAYGFGMKMWKDHQAMLERQPVIMGGRNPAPVKMTIRALVDLEIIAYPERAIRRQDLLEALSLDDGIVQFTEVHSIEFRGNKPCPR